MNPRRLTAVACLLTAAGCVAPVETEPAYASEHFLCGPESEQQWMDEVEDCRVRYEDDESCAGVISFEGLLEDIPVALDGEVSKAEFVDAIDGDGAALRDAVKIYGRTPYFLFTLQLKEIGGETLDAQERTLRVGRADGPLEELTDETVRPSLRMSVAGDSADLAGRSGELVIERQSASEQAGTFALRFGSAGDELDGCFHVFATERTFYTADEVNSDAR
jgi:hypothetical protein